MILSFFKAQIQKAQSLFVKSGSVDFSDDQDLAEYCDAIAESPVKNHIMVLLKEINFESKAHTHPDDRMAVKNALYLVVIERIGELSYDGELKPYLCELLVLVDEAKQKFDIVCFDNKHAAAAFLAFKLGVIALLDEIET